MRIVIAECSVDYQGRGKTTLARAVRMILVKRDGSVSIHSDDRAYKPLNWMLPPCFIEIVSVKGKRGKPHQKWVITNKNETLTIDIFEVISESEHALAEEEPGLTRSWTEAHLQVWIANHVEDVFGSGWSFIAREYPTGAGPVDILVRDPHGVPVAVEVKRTAQMGALDQCARYIEAMRANPETSNAQGMVVALKVKPRAQELGKTRGIKTMEIPEHLYKQ